MIIKKWDTTLNSGAGGWAEQYPKTVGQKVFNNAGTVAIFDSNDKIKPAYLPDAVFDSLYFFGTVASAPNDIRSLGVQAVQNAASIGRSALGYYWVASASAGVNSSTGTIQTGSPLVYVTTSGINPSEEGVSSGTGVTLETGDWVVITNITGLGTQASPYSFTFATINNTYALMTGATGSAAGTPGIVPTPALGQQGLFLRGDATWATPTDTNTTYSVSTAAGANAYTELIRLTAGGSGSGNDDVAIAVGATALKTFSALTTSGSATLSVANTGGLLIGQLVTGTNIPANSLITAIDPGLNVTISNAATGTGGGTLTASTFGLTIEQASDVITVRHADTSNAADLAASSRTYVSALTFDTFGHVIGYSTATETVVDTDTHHQAGIYIGATGTLTNAATTNGNTYIKLVENGTARTSNLIQGSGATTVTTDASGNITISSTDTNTTYTAGNGISLNGSNEFSVAAGEGLTQEASGLKMTYPVYHGDTLPTTGISANAIGLEW